MAATKKKDATHTGEEQKQRAKPKIRVEDKRHWARPPEERGEEGGEEPSPPSTQPTIVDQYRQRAEDAERQLQEYIHAFKSAQRDHEAFRDRLNRNVERRVQLQFGELLSELLETVDDLDRAVEHADGGGPEVKALADGVRLARDRFLAALERHGVERIAPAGEQFDPETAEAVRMDPVSDPSRNHHVTEVLRPGYRLGDHVVRPARVAVGRFSSSGDEPSPRG